MPCALSPAIDSSIVRSALSEPSVTTTRPATGRPLSSLRARSSASPRRVAVPSNFRSSVYCSRSAYDENRKMRRLKRLPSAVSSGASARAEFIRRERAARLAVVVGHLHAARVVEQDADEVLLRHRDLEQQHRPQQAEQHDREQADPRWPAAPTRSRPAERGDLPVRPEGVQRSLRRRSPPSATSSGWLRNANRPCSKYQQLGT